MAAEVAGSHGHLQMMTAPAAPATLVTAPAPATAQAPVMAAVGAQATAAATAVAGAAVGTAAGEVVTLEVIVAVVGMTEFQGQALCCQPAVTSASFACHFCMWRQHAIIPYDQHLILTMCSWAHQVVFGCICAPYDNLAVVC
jgi:hypothetical protein